MAVYQRGYVRYDGDLTGRLARLLVLPRFAGRQILSQRIVTLVLAMAMFWPIGSAVYIYLVNRADLLQGFGSELPALLTVDSAFFVIFMNAQSGFAIVLAALVGPSLVAPDLANGALSLYFSRPQSRTEYIVARMLVLVGLLSLITWFLIPARREVLLLGKYLAGLIASIGIFSFGAALCYLVMLWPQEAAARAAFWPDPGLSHLLWYCAASALACVGYGSVFLAAGLLLRNPIIPAVVILFWEGLNPVLPALLQKLSVLYYVQALTPVPAPTDPGAPLLVQLFMAPAAPPSAVRAVFGLLALTAVVLWVAARSVRRLEINYSTE